VGEYNRALREGLQQARLTEREVERTMQGVLEQQAQYGITAEARFAEIPGHTGVEGGVHPREVATPDE
jgi:hypothetical protein